MVKAGAMMALARRSILMRESMILCRVDVWEIFDWRGWVDWMCCDVNCGKTIERVAGPGGILKT